MDYLNDPTILGIIGLLLVIGYLALHPQRRPDIWLIVVTISLFVLPRAGFVLSRLNVPLPLAHMLVALCVCEWLFLRHARRMEPSSLHGYFLIYAAIVGLSLAIGLATGGKYLTAFLELCFYLFAIGLFFYVTETFTERRQFDQFMRLVLLAAGIVSVYGVAQHYWGSSLLIEHVTYNSGSGLARSYVENPEVHRRVLSSYGDPNVLASQLVVFFAIAAALVIGRGVPSSWRLMALGLLLLCGLCTFHTGSRAGLVCLAIVTFAVFCWRSRWAFVFLPIIAVVFVLVIPGMLETALLSRFSHINTVSDMRVQFPQMAWELLRSIPFGCGLGNAVELKTQGFSWLFAVNPSGTLWGGFNSFWLNLFSRMGLPGLLAFACLVGALLRHIGRQIRFLPDGRVRAFVWGGLVGFGCQMLIWLLNNTYILPGGGLNFWFMMGMLVAGCRAYTAPAPVLAAYPSSAWPAASGRQVAPA